MNEGLRIFRENTGAPIEEVVTAVTKTPAKEPRPLRRASAH